MHQSIKKISAEMNKSKLKIKANETFSSSGKQSSDCPLEKFTLSGNLLRGNILIGNYNYLTHLEVSENEIEVLDLSSLALLETLKCCGNKLMELLLNGKNLTSIMVNYNNLHKISVMHTPSKLTFLDMSHNYFTDLPSWIGACSDLHTLNASNNQLKTVNDLFSLANYKIKSLRYLDLSYNYIYTLNGLTNALLTLQSLKLQSNALEKLPENFFENAHKTLKVFNASCNKLAVINQCSSEIPREEGSALEYLYISNNNINNSIFGVLERATKLRVLHAAYNRISELPDACARNWLAMEVLVLSGNSLQCLPDMSAMVKLQVLRMHSNLLLYTPTLSKLSALKVLDLAHNHLDRVNLLQIMPKNLKYLDLSCNLQLQVDENQLKVCQSQRNWSLVDVSGKNRLHLPTTKLNNANDSSILKPPWTVGFSETPGNCNKLSICQLRFCNYQKDEEGLFGMFSNGITSTAAVELVKTVPHILQQERRIKENRNEYMKYTLLAFSQKLMSPGDMNEVGATLCHIVREGSHSKWNVKPQKSKHFMLRVASIGNICSYLVRKTSTICLSRALVQKDIAMAISTKITSSTSSVPDPEIFEIVLTNEDEYLVICNTNIWKVMDIDRVAREMRKEENVVLAAKRIQDIAQSFGAEKCLSTIVVRFRNVGTDVDYLIKELKQTVRKKPPLLSGGNVCSRACFNYSNYNQRILERQLPARDLPFSRSDRSSPSGQSDHAQNHLNKDVDGEEYILAHARLLKEENELEMVDETNSVLSEEQFKCWEYMLEQNTQLLFDKELNTLSKSCGNETKAKTTQDELEFSSNMVRGVHGKLMSTSSPQLLGDGKKSFLPSAYQQHLSLLSKNFGSSRSYQSGFNHFKSLSRDSLTIKPYSKFGGGPNAAYFGSLQRLIPYNLEYNFALTQERSLLDDDEDYLEQEDRMRKYWGVATTEL